MVSSEDLYLNRAKFVMKHLGVWVPLEDESVYRKIYRAFIMTLQYLLLFFQIINAIQVWGDLDEVSQVSCLLFTQACLCFKLTIFQKNMDMLKKLLELMDQEIFRPQNSIHEKMPVSPEKTVQYLIGYAFQVITVSLSASMYFGLDSVAFSSVIFGCAQLDIIKEKIMSITHVVGQRGSTEVTQALSENYKKLVNCVKHHQAIVTFTQLVESAYHPYLLFQLTGSVGIICMSALRLLTVDWRSMHFLSILAYVLLMVSQLFLCCWCGHELTATSEDLHTVLYKCIWYEQDIKFKRDLCFAMMRMRRPLVLRAGHYIGLSRQTFVTILRTSYSYFAVLNQTK